MALETLAIDSYAASRQYNAQRIKDALDVLSPDDRHFQDRVKLPLLRGCVCVDFFRFPSEEFVVTNSAQLTASEAEGVSRIAIDNIRTADGELVLPPTILFYDKSLELFEDVDHRRYDGFSVDVTDQAQTLYGHTSGGRLILASPNSWEADSFISVCLLTLESRLQPANQ